MSGTVLLLVGREEEWRQIINKKTNKKNVISYKVLHCKLQ